MPEPSHRQWASISYWTTMFDTSASDKCNLALHVKELGNLKIWIVRFHVVGLYRN